MPFEQPPIWEFSEKEQRLIALLHEKGPQDPEAREMLLWWCDKAGEQARESAEMPSRAEIEVQVKLARIYRAAGGYDSAWETLEAVRFAAMNDPNAQDLYDKVMMLMDEIDAERNK